jgi:hypothetical protein
MTKEEVIETVKKATEELGRIPTYDELVRSNRVKKQAIRRHFGQYRAVLEACGLEVRGSGHKLGLKMLFLDWAAVVRKLGKVPTLLEYKMHGKHCAKPLTRYFGGWPHVPAGLLRYAQEQGLEGEWKGEMEVITRYMESAPAKVRNSSWTTGMSFRPKLNLDEPIYGPPMVDAHLLMEPTNEQGVIFLFGAFARKLGFAVIQIRTAYPDCEAYREVEPGRWQRVWLEFEEESRNFLKHGHDPTKCRLIVCWSHNWPECPLEVLELKSAVKGLTTD